MSITTLTSNPDGSFDLSSLFNQQNTIDEQSNVNENNNNIVSKAWREWKEASLSKKILRLVLIIIVTPIVIIKTIISIGINYFSKKFVEPVDSKDKEIAKKIGKILLVPIGIFFIGSLIAKAL